MRSRSTGSHHVPAHRRHGPHRLCLRQFSRRSYPLRLLHHGDHHRRQQRYRCLLVTVAYSKAGTFHTLTADFCICTVPIAALDQTKNNFSPETQKAFTGMPMTAQYKIAWESPRSWEKENNIYGGISFLDNTVDLVWYPTDKMFSPTGVIIAGFNLEGEDLTGKLTPFGALPSTQAKLDASRAAVERLHPGRSHLLMKPSM